MARKTVRIITTSPEKLEKISKKNISLMKQFLREKSTRTSPLTIKNYESDLNIFFVWCMENLDNKFFVDIRKLEFSEFFSWCVEDLNWGSARTNRMRSTLSSLSQFIEKFLDDDYPMFRNVILTVIDSMPKDERREKTVLSKEQVEKIMEELSKKDSQKACWFALAVASGARFSELLRFTIDNIEPNNRAYDNIFIETIKPIKTKGRGRDGKLLHKYIIADIFLPYYYIWLDERKKIMEKSNQNHNFIFIKKDGSPAESGTTRSWVNTIDKMLGDGVNFYTHSLRHYLTTYLSKIGLPPSLIRDLFGWSSITLVELYDDTQSKDKKWDELEALKDDLK